MNRRLVLFVVVLAASFLLGCGPKWRVITQARPSPLYLKGTFAVLPIDYTGLHVGEKPEAVYLAEKSADQDDNFRQDKVALNEEFAAALMAHAIRVRRK